MIRTHQLKGNDLIGRLKELSQPLNESINDKEQTLDELLEELGFHLEEVEDELEDLTDNFVKRNKEDIDKLNIDKKWLKQTIKNIGIEPFVSDSGELDEIISELEKDLENEFGESNIYRWGYYDGERDIDVSNLTKQELRDLINRVLTDREDSMEEMFEGVLNVGTLQFSSSLSTNNKTLVFIPRSSKMLDTIENMKVPKRDIVDKIINVLKKKYRGLNFRPSNSYDGFGYGIDVDMFSFV